ncbi:alpha/beta-hydrolase [Auricularia subglabra TFB-10046 SS5]|nr:alpha/beta-hydrolase [Auricularia subglabra TFB-10046 SS5]
MLSTLVPLATLLVPAFAGILPRQASDPASFDWYALEPSDDIKWTPCFEGRLCARLNLPLDYTKPDGPKTQIALHMLPATDKANYQGTIFVNPGGPSSPGTQFVLSSGKKLASIFGPSFDILGWDPRGTGATTPLIRCFDSPNDTNRWRSELGMMWDRPQDTSVQRTKAHMQIIHPLCKDNFGGNGKEEIGASATEWGPGRFLGTQSVVQDMVNIAEKLGQPKLRYYGISYGTTIGQYLATLHPDKIERMIIDGVQDGYHWLNALNYDITKDMGLVIDEFYKNCVDAGPSRCAVWEKTPRAVERRMTHILDQLRNEPISVSYAATGPFVLTEDVFLEIAFSAFYHPLTGFPGVADLALAVEAKNQTFLSAMARVPADASDFPPWDQPNEAVFAVECADWPPYEDTIEEGRAYLRHANSFVPRLGLYGASSVTQIRLVCSGWPIKSKDRYTGQLVGKVPVNALVASQSLDPVTPLDAARNITMRYPGTRLFVQNGTGHATWTTMSNCTANVFRNYMITGELPPEGTTCEQDLKPFIDTEDLDYELDAHPQLQRLFSHPFSRF